MSTTILSLKVPHKGQFEFHFCWILGLQKEQNCACVASHFCSLWGMLWLQHNHSASRCSKAGKTLILSPVVIDDSFWRAVSVLGEHERIICGWTIHPTSDFSFPSHNHEWKENFTNPEGSNFHLLFDTATSSSSARSSDIAIAWHYDQYVFN